MAINNSVNSGQKLDSSSSPSFAGINYPGGFKNVKKVTLVQSDVTGMFTTPVVIVPAPVSGIVVVSSCSASYVGGTNAFGGGGNIVLQYGNTASGGGTSAMNGTRLASSTFLTGGTTNQFVMSTGINSITPFTSSNLNATGIYLSNTVAAFTNAGSGASLIIYVEYYIAN